MTRKLPLLDGLLSAAGVAVFTGAILAADLAGELLRIEGRGAIFLFHLGALLISCGIPAILYTAYHYVSRSTRMQYLNHGPWRCSRHPAHFIFLVFLLPGCAFLMRSWLVLLSVIPVLYCYYLFIPRWEAVLLRFLGDQYADYQKRVPRFFPQATPGIDPRRRGVRVLVCIAATVLCLNGVVIVWILPSVNGWGATLEECTRILPGDEMITDTQLRYTQAVTLDAPPEQVWPWLVQMGYGRGGWYDFDGIRRWTGNARFATGRQSADSIVPSLQTLASGDTLALDARRDFFVRIDGNTSLILISDNWEATTWSAGEAVWSFVLEPADNGKTRLLTRYQARYPLTFGNRIRWALREELGGAGFQRPAMLYGLKRRISR